MSIQKYNKAKRIGESMRVLTPWFRAAFANVHQISKPKDPTKEGRYEVTLLLDEKSVDITALKVVAYECAKTAFGNKVPHSPTYDLPPWCRSPFHDGAEKPDYDGYEGMTYFRASTNFKPQVIDSDRVEIGPMDQPGFYSGCFARATVSPWAFDNEGKGIAFNIHNIQKLAEGTPFGGMAKVDACDEFDAASDFEGPEDFNFGANTNGGEPESWM